MDTMAAEREKLPARCLFCGKRQSSCFLFRGRARGAIFSSMGEATGRPYRLKKGEWGSEKERGFRLAQGLLSCAPTPSPRFVSPFKAPVALFSLGDTEAPGLSPDEECRGKGSSCISAYSKQGLLNRVMQITIIRKVF